MSQRLTVAVVIPTIPGREELLQRALTSVIEQRRVPDQLIVELDGERTGAAATRNRALQRVGTDLIAWLDDDDALLPHHIRLLVGLLERMPDVELLYPTPRMEPLVARDPTAVTVGGVWRSPWGVPFGEEQREHIKRRGSFIPITHVVRAEIVRDVGGFPEGVTLPNGRYRGEDEGYLLRLLDAGAKFAHVNVQTWLWYVHIGNTGGMP